MLWRSTHLSTGDTEQLPSPWHESLPVPNRYSAKRCKKREGRLTPFLKNEKLFFCSLTGLYRSCFLAFHGFNGLDWRLETRPVSCPHGTKRDHLSLDSELSSAVRRTAYVQLATFGWSVRILDQSSNSNRFNSFFLNGWMTYLHWSCQSSQKSIKPKLVISRFVGLWMLTLDDCPGPAFLHSFVGEFGESFQALDGLWVSILAWDI